MMYLSVFCLCTAGLFLALLEDRFRMWITLAISGAAYALSLILAAILRHAAKTPVLAEQLPCGAACLVFFLASLVQFRNNPLQKFYLALLSLCDYAFLGFFLPLLLGVSPLSPAGAMGGVLSVVLTCLFTLLMGLCLYHPLRHFKDRGPSGFLVGMCLLLFALYAICLGKVDFLFRTNIPAARLLCAAALYVAMLFAFRSVYQAGRFRQKADREANHALLLRMRSGDFADSLAAVEEIRDAQKAEAYAMDTIKVLLTDGDVDRAAKYTEIAKENSAKNPILGHYHNNPYLDAVIAAKAAFAARNHIDFQCNAVTEGAPFSTAELCVIINEMLSRACLDAMLYQGERRVSLTTAPNRGNLVMEVVFTSPPPAKKVDWRVIDLSDLLEDIFEDADEENDLRGLENTADVISRFSGKLTVSHAGSETIIQASVKY